ncbi:LacI family DNA-binding transcriptional regulator [Pseudarthrobacter sp. fls2-241-R2A-127]|uniref:ParB family protein n=1 Tax=Pseudarthrobacter sp. fls2-241-R2A-127 TaxID=3040303 RepID=UPI003305AEBC
MTDVAAAAYVSVATVSNVLRNPDIVAPHTRLKVWDAIRALEYSPSPQVTPLSKSKQGTSRRKRDTAATTGEAKRRPTKAKSIAHINPYFTPDQAAQIRAALQAVGPGEGYVSLSDLVVAATMEEVKRLQQKYNGGRSWPGVPAGMIRRGRPTRGQEAVREDLP